MPKICNHWHCRSVKPHLPIVRVRDLSWRVAFAQACRTMFTEARSAVLSAQNKGEAPSEVRLPTFVTDVLCGLEVPRPPYLNYGATPIAACAAARRATGTRKGEQLT